MKKACLIFCLLLSLSALGQQQTVTLDDMVQSASEWAKENLDEDTLHALQGADQEKVKQFFETIQKGMQGEYVADLAQLREGAKLILPLLESHEETFPYSVWLKTRMDYLEVANEFRILIPPPKTKPDEPAPVPVNPPADKEREVWIQKFSDRPVPDEAKPYVSTLKPVFKKQGVPPELIWIAEVESSFDPRAKSPAGAAGLFQLMPATAKQYGLRTWPFDQRYKPEESARAAAQHLSYLYKRFKDWRLVLAAYNSGEGTVQKHLDRQKTKTFDAIAPRLPAETQLYVPKVEAAIQRREGVKLTSLAAPMTK